MAFMQGVRGIFAATVAAAAMASAPATAAIDPSYSGSWYNPPESGSGFNLEIFDDQQALLFWYTYDDNGDAVWLYSEGAITGDVIEFDTYFAQGMRFSDLDTADKDNRFWGTVRMEFADCNNATITYSSVLGGLEHSPVGTRTHPVQRLVNIDSLPCRAPIEGYFVGSHRDPTLNGGAGAFADLRGVLTGDGRVFFASDMSSEVFLGTWTIGAGGALQLDYEICPTDGGTCVPATSSGVSYAGKDYVRGTGNSAVWGAQPFGGTYRTLYDREVTLASLAGTWTVVNDEPGANTTITIGADGSVSGSNTFGCVFAGGLVQPDPHFNQFDYAGTVSGCMVDEWSGVAINIDNFWGDRSRLQFIIEDAGGGDAFVLMRN